MFSLSSKVINYVLGGLLAVFMAISGWLYISNNSLENDVLRKESAITTLQVQRDSLVSSNETLKNAIETQNQSVENLAAVKASIDGMFADFNKNVVSLNKQTKDIKSAIEKETTPQTCKEAMDYLRNARKEIQ